MTGPPRTLPESNPPLTKRTESVDPLRRMAKIDRLPQDPWGKPYQYLSPGVHGDFDIFTFGADGVTGGDGVDADIGTWTEG